MAAMHYFANTINSHELDITFFFVYVSISLTRRVNVVNVVAVQSKTPLLALSEIIDKDKVWASFRFESEHSGARKFTIPRIHTIAYITITYNTLWTDA